MHDLFNKGGHQLLVLAHNGPVAVDEQHGVVQGARHCSGTPLIKAHRHIGVGFAGSFA